MTIPHPDSKVDKIPPEIKLSTERATMQESKQSEEKDKGKNSSLFSFINKI
jgi:hypothetical protein